MNKRHSRPTLLTMRTVRSIDNCQYILLYIFSVFYFVCDVSHVAVKCLHRSVPCLAFLLFICSLLIIDGVLYERINMYGGISSFIYNTFQRNAYIFN